MNIDQKIESAIVKNPAVNLRNGEVCMYQTNCKYGEQVEKVTTKSKPGIGIGIGIPVTEHFGIGISRRKVKTTTKREMVWEKTGATILFTSERFICKLGSKVFQLEYDTFNDIKLNKDAITIVSNRRPYTFFMSNKDVQRFMSIWELMGEANNAGYDLKKRSSIDEDDAPSVTVEVAAPSVTVEVPETSSPGFEGCVDNNLKGIQLEKEGEIDKAIELYEANVAAGFDGSHPYKRLSIIYRKRKDYDNEIRVLSQAIVAVNDKEKNEELYSRLLKAKELQTKEKKND